MLRYTILFFLMKSVAIITYKDAPNLSDSDSVLIWHLAEKGFHAEPVQWDSKTDWSKYDCLVIRSCWDYHLRAKEFMQWLDLLQKQNITVWNPIEILRWNHKKNYLKELTEKGIDIIPTVWLEKDSSLQLADILRENNWEKAAIKPIIGASAHNIFLASMSDATLLQEKLDEMLKHSEVMIQPFIKEIQTGGELSIMFIGGEYSHTVVKMPKENDFRSNYFGSAVKLTQPSKEILEQAKKVYSTIDVPLLYARVDGVNVNNNLLLMEFELIEPYLFFEHFPEAGEKFAEALGKLNL
jgi:glutathione synthase/RimK-type ligase-like ATP-grasp enzyme